MTARDAAAGQPALRECPFCGGETAISDRGASPDDRTMYEAFCFTRGCAGNHASFSERTDAIAAWNRRVERAGDAARASELAEADYIESFMIGSDDFTPEDTEHLKRAVELLRSLPRAPLDRDTDEYKVLEILARPENVAAEQMAHDTGTPAVITVPAWVCHYAAKRLSALAAPERAGGES